MNRKLNLQFFLFSVVLMHSSVLEIIIKMCVSKRLPVGFIYSCVCHLCVGAHRGQKGAVDPLQLELGGSGEHKGSESFSPLIVWLQGSNSVCQA